MRLAPRFAVLASVLLLGAAGLAAQPSKFDGAAALRHVERLVAIGPRVAGSPGGAQARAYLVGELKRLPALQVQVKSFEAETPHGRMAMANVVAVLPGRRPDVVMVAGHYDTKLFNEFRFVGANDGGSSAALLLELARQLAATPRDYTYWLVWFDGEEARGDVDRPRQPLRLPPSRHRPGPGQAAAPRDDPGGHDRRPRSLDPS